MATGPFEFNPETREFTRRGSVRSWPVDEGTAADMPAVSTIEEELSESDDMPVGVLVNPAPIRRRRRSYAASETPPANTSNTVTENTAVPTTPEADNSARISRRSCT